VRFISKDLLGFGLFRDLQDGFSFGFHLLLDFIDDVHVLLPLVLQVPNRLVILAPEILC
jgi:hypothetical protein